MEINIRNVVAFCVLMQNGNGILDKSPDYIKAKFEILIERKIKHPSSLLDHPNGLIYLKWFQRWIE